MTLRGIFLRAVCLLLAASISAPAGAAPPPRIKVIKKLIPDTDPGKFNLRIDGAVRASNVGHNGTTGVVAVSAGLHTISETSGAGTSLSDYRTTFSGDCDAQGQVTAAMAQLKTCIITNEKRRWKQVAPMPHPHMGFGAGVINGIIYVVGGGYIGTPFTTLQAYNTNNNTWSLKAPLPSGRSGSAVAVVNGILYAIGGMAPLGIGAAAHTTVYAYDPTTNTWATKAPLPGPRADAAAAVINGIIYVAGGHSTSAPNSITATLYAYNPATNTWSTKAPMPTARSYAGAVAVNSKLYVMGGYDTASLASVLAYNPATNTWTTKTPMPVARRGFGLAVLNGKIYAMGGFTSLGNLPTAVHVYNPPSGNWSTILPTLTAHSYGTGAAAGAYIYAISGQLPSGVTAQTERYQP